MRGSSGGAHFAGGREFNCSWRYYLIGVFDLTNAEQYLQNAFC
jgi:hypothetical protein